MPSVSRYRTWLAVPADEIEDLKKAHPPMNGHTPVLWDKEHKLWFARPGADLSMLDRWLPRPQEVSMNGSDPVTEFAQVLENAGLVLKELPAMDGKIHRVPTTDDKNGQKSGAYRGFLDGRPAGWYRDYRSADDSPVNWTFSGGEQTDPRARLHLKAHSLQRREDAERETTTTPPIPDSIVYAPERSDAPISLNMDEILKELDWEKRADRTVLYKLDGKPAFIDRVNRLEMVNGASNDDRSVLAALAVATKFYGGVIELTGSDAFKQKAMQLIIEHNIDVRMKLPDQRAELEKLRKEMAVSKDAVVTHQPTPELNRNTPEQPAVPDPVQEKEATQSPASPVAPEASTVSTASAPSPAEPGKTADVAPDEEPPGKLRPGESVTAVLHNFGRAEYAPGKGESFFVELKNRSGSKLYWGEQLESLVKNHQKGDVVTLTLQNREQFILPGEQKARFRNKWSMESVTNGISVSHDNPDKGQRIQAIPVETFMKVAAQISQGWPEEMKALRMPENVGSHLFIGEDRHPVSAPQNANQVTEITSAAPDKLTPVLGSVDKDTRELNLLLVQSADEHLQGVVRLNGTLYPALATPSADNSQLVINALTDKGLRFAGYGEAVNHDADSTNRPAPELMQFHLKTREEPLFAAVYTPEKQPDALYRNLGFEQSWQQWSNSQKPEDRQEKTLHQDLSHSPGR
ncbi:DUF5710 domain-containing protein [Escherichia coli]|nr:DUF5710 domain-containing protein [Escherichia coli]